jgi:hypothetical protein
VQAGCLEVRTQQLAAGIATFAAMHSRGREAQRLEQAVDVVDRPATHEGDRASTGAIEITEQVKQRIVDADLVGSGREVEQGSVDIEEQAAGPISRHRGLERHWFIVRND